MAPPERKQTIRIHIGDFYATREPGIIQTVLGSCVATCLFDPVGRIGGMNHILLPGEASLSSFNGAARYGINAMELLINRIMGLNGSRDRLLAKVFGGAHVIPAMSEENAPGKKNAAFAVDFLEREGIRIVSRDLGGNEGRMIYFHSDTGDVFLKRIPIMQAKGIVRTERKRIKQVKIEIRAPGDLTLF